MSASSNDFERDDESIFNKIYQLAKEKNNDALKKQKEDDEKASREKEMLEAYKKELQEKN